MFNPNKITKILGATFVLVSSSSVMAETLSVPSTVTVDNTINFTLAGTLDFGTVRAIADATSATNCVGLTVPANPASAISSTLGTEGAIVCTAAGIAAIQNVGGTVARPTFSVAGLAPFTDLDLTLPQAAAAIDLTLSVAPAGAAVLRLLDFTAYQSSGSSPSNVALTAGAGTVTADSVGDIVFNVGATVLTDPGTPTGTYENIAYSGTFDVQVEF